MILCVIFTLFVGGVSAEDVTSDVDNAVLADSISSDLSQVNVAVDFEF